METSEPTGQKVNYVTEKGAIRQGTILEQLSPGAARIQLNKTDSVLAQHSLEGEPGSFHYPSEEVKKTSASASKAASTESTK